ncbi:hypothetical protein CDAR_463581 [Caerostris darwini]|uniref:Secreted protein n=1 Tax=Caerostris darwini TaxID=1538125 RepID=A0AAV4RJX2_9ARAC|nr:hypothetical protein CDAR_463581 [Caerostris darwini]
MVSPFRLCDLWSGVKLSAICLSLAYTCLTTTRCQNQKDQAPCCLTSHNISISNDSLHLPIGRMPELIAWLGQRLSCVIANRAWTLQR